MLCGCLVDALWMLCGCFVVRDEFKFDIQRTCIVIYSYNKTNEMH